MLTTIEDPTTQTLTPEGEPLVVVIEERALIRDCLVHCLAPLSSFDIVAVARVEEWAERCGTHIANLFIICLAANRHLDSCYQTLDKVLELGAPAILLSDSTDPAVIFDALQQRGAKGYIPTNMPLAAAAAAIQFVGGGGVFVPIEVLHGPALQRPRPVKGFTARQMAVMDALRHGKANKTIAHELNMRESTVKVHVRKIMRKLNATNRTQAAYLGSQFMNGEHLTG